MCQNPLNRPVPEFLIFAALVAFVAVFLLMAVTEIGEARYEYLTEHLKCLQISECRQALEATP